MLVYVSCRTEAYNIIGNWRRAGLQQGVFARSLEVVFDLLDPFDDLCDQSAADTRNQAFGLLESEAEIHEGLSSLIVGYSQGQLYQRKGAGGQSSEGKRERDQSRLTESRAGMITLSRIMSSMPSSASSSP